MADGCSTTSAGQDESCETGQETVQPVYFVLHMLDQRGGDGVCPGIGRLRAVGGQVRAKGEEGVLHATDKTLVLLVGQVGGQQAETGVQFVYCAIGFQTDVCLGDADAAYQRGGAGIAGLGIKGAFFVG